MDWGGGSEKTVLESVRDGAVRAGGVKYNPTTLGDMRRWTFIRKRGGGDDDICGVCIPNIYYMPGT